MPRSEQDRVDALVEALLRGDRLGRAGVKRLDPEVVRMAILFAIARKDNGRPDPAFVRNLAGSLAAGPGAGVAGTALLTRRLLLRASVLMAAAAAGGAAGSALQARLGAPAATSGSRLVPDRPAWRPVMAEAALPQGRAVAFGTAGIEGVLLNDAGLIRALSAACTHMGCLLTPNEAARRLDCPCHGLSFDWRGRALRSPRYARLAAANLPLIPTRARKGMLEVLVPRSGST